MEKRATVNLPEIQRAATEETPARTSINTLMSMGHRAPLSTCWMYRERKFTAFTDPTGRIPGASPVRSMMAIRT